MRTILTTLHSKFIHPSLALPYLAAFCAEDCGELLIREFTVHEPKENVLAELLAEAPDSVAFSVYLWNRRETLELVDALHAVRPALRIVLGGPEVSFEGAALFHRHPGVTAVVCGEGELPFRGLLGAWTRNEAPGEIPRLLWRDATGVRQNADAPPLADLDRIPSPFTQGLVDLSRGFVYYETSRGCPYTCAFCMSSLDARVRSFSMERIRHDLGWLMARKVPKIKLVDRTFNYDPARTRDIFAYILKHNRASHFHFEIGAHLLEEETLTLLEKVPEGMFQFEIGVQSTLPATLDAIGRQTSLERLEANVRRLRRQGNIRLHLDLIAGLPGEGYQQFLASIDRVAALAPHHLQIEPVKLLPGSPLRAAAAKHGLCSDPTPPYAVLATADLSFAELERLRGIGRLLDLTFNSGRFHHFLEGLQKACSSLGQGLGRLEAFWQKSGRFRHPLSQRSLFEGAWHFAKETFDGTVGKELEERIAYDFALTERVVPGNVPAFFDTELTDTEMQAVRDRVRREAASLKGLPVKIQYFSAAFTRLPNLRKRTVLLFLYLTQAGKGMTVREFRLE